MVAYEYFDSTSDTTTQGPPVNINIKLRDKLQSSLDKYNAGVASDDAEIGDFITQMKSNATGPITDDSIKAMSGLNTELSRKMKTSNRHLVSKLGNAQDISNRNVKKLQDYNTQRIKQISSDNQGISTALAGTPDSRMGQAAREYNNRLNTQADKQEKLIDQIRNHDGEYQDAKLKRESYRFQSAIFSILFVIIVGLLIRATLTTQSNAIETLILFLAIALALYYLIEYIF
jgi:hypothetical protein